jgi:GNAT superfamily N-acetyltransferase
VTSRPTIRPLADPDLPTACRLAWDALQQVSVATGHRAVDYDDVTRSWLEGRARHLLAHDAPGCWVAEEGGELLGVALSLRRDDFWFLSLLSVRIGRQGRGIGRLLLDAARGHAAGTTSGAIAASMDPKALRRYAAAGFDLLPCYEVTGRPRTDPAAVVDAREAVRPGVLPADRPLLDAVDRAVRGATRGPDWNFLLPGMQLLVADGAPGERGYALVRDVAVGAVVAETPAAGARLLRAALARVAPTHDDAPVAGWIDGSQQWAVRVAQEAGLSLAAGGSVCLRTPTGSRAAHLLHGAFG